MQQTRLMSLVESLATVVVGFELALLVQIRVFPAIGRQATVMHSMKLSVALTLLSTGRGQLLHRVFEAMHIQIPGEICRLEGRRLSRLNRGGVRVGRRTGKSSSR